MRRKEIDAARRMYRVIASFDLHRGTYRVVVAADPPRGYEAKLASVGIGTLMYSYGKTPQEAASRLARDMREGALDATDRELAKEFGQKLEVYQHSWGVR